MEVQLKIILAIQFNTRYKFFAITHVVYKNSFKSAHGSTPNCIHKTRKENDRMKTNTNIFQIIFSPNTAIWNTCNPSVSA